MTTITQQDRELLELVYGGSFAFKPMREKQILEAFARHRLRTIEECAKIADRHDTGDCTREDMEARRIAADIRKMGE